MIRRSLASEISTLALKRHKMAFISGPRQCGKTTLAKSLIEHPKLYFNWDQLKFRQQWTKNPEQIAHLALQEESPRIILDELHKNRRWKRELKGFYDEYGEHIEIIVTGSARLDIYKKGGDSLLGRFYHFHLFPFSLGEYLQNKITDFDTFENFIHSTDLISTHKKRNVEAKNLLLKFGGFPEPLLSQKEEILRLWQRNRMELLIRQDLRDLAQIQEISQVETLASLLPLKIGSSLSIQSLREDIEVAFTTVKRWLGLLQALYYHFEVKPYSKSLSRSIKKEPKIYLYDWSTIEEPGARFENMAAVHLLKMCQYWNDIGTANLELFYLRNKEKKEVDFLILKNKKPWFTVEAKLSQLTLDQSFLHFQSKLKIPHFQIVNTDNIARLTKNEFNGARIMSFEQFFNNLP